MSLGVNLLSKSTAISWKDARYRTKSIRAEALLVYMCLGTETEVSREVLASLLWEDNDPKRSRDSLRQVLRGLKKTVGDLSPSISVGRGKIRVDHGAVTLDINLALEQLQTDQLVQGNPVAEVAIDDILSNFAGISSSFDAWIAITRNRIESRLKDTLGDLMLDQQRDAKLREFAARSLLNMDPTNEPACQVLMRTYGERGDQSAAIKIYDTLFLHLDQDYDIEPTEETINLIAAIKMGTLARVGTSAQTNPEPDRSQPAKLPSIFVTDFLTETENDHPSIMTRMFRQELIANLSTYREWLLFDFEPNEPAYYRLDGLVSGFDGQITFIATLRQESDGRIIWSERFQVGYQNWRSVQGQIAQRLSLAVNQSITNDRLNSNLSPSPQNPDVFGKWVQSQDLLNDWKPENTEKALVLLNEITEQAPRFSGAHASLAAVSHVFHIVYPGKFRSDQETDRGMYHAQKAMEIDPLDTQSHRVTAWSKALKGEFDLSVFHFERCWELNPNLLYTRVSIALGFAFADRSDRACAIADETREIARTLHPFHWGYLQNVYYLAGRLDDARYASEMAGDAIFNLPAWQAATLWELGEKEQAQAAGAHFLRLVRQNWYADQPANRENVINWLTHCFPLKNETQRTRLRQGIERATLDELPA